MSIYNNSGIFDKLRLMHSIRKHAGHITSLISNYFVYFAFHAGPIHTMLFCSFQRAVFIMLIKRIYFNTVLKPADSTSTCYILPNDVLVHLYFCWLIDGYLKIIFPISATCVVTLCQRPKFYFLRFFLKFVIVYYRATWIFST